MSLFSIFRKRFFTREEEKNIVQAIKKAEFHTSGEVRIHFSSKLVKDVYSDATEVFTKLGMQNTERRNGVLIYIVPSEKQFAIIGDEGFHQFAGDDFWQSVKDKMQNLFREGNFVEGLILGLEEVGTVLKAHFPREDNDTNELTDNISYGE